MLAGSTGVSAQGLGGLLKKGKNVAEKILSVQGEDKAESVATEDTPVLLESGISVFNPIAEFIEIAPVGLYGVSKSENFGDAYLVLKVKNKLSKESASFGSSIQNKKMIAVDNGDKTYNINASGSYRYDTPQDIVVVLKLDEPNLMFTDINRNINQMQVVKFGVIIDAAHQGNVTLKNVPIFWDQQPEEL